MIDYIAMVKNEEMSEVILFLVGRYESGTTYPDMDRFFGMYKAEEKYNSYNIKLIHDKRALEESGQIFSAKIYGAGIQKGPNWKEPKFVTEKKYGIE
ncbi:hypothetical protein [Erwinia sp. SLM-02]|uniref:hypothetical protein n=1 Tax=Erwinia sp. SLM-02 TaxID=3020057 RepID=UPI0030808A36